MLLSVVANPSTTRGEIAYEITLSGGTLLIAALYSPPLLLSY